MVDGGPVRTLVTGGAGRLGRSVVAVLAASGRHVFSVDRTTSEGLPARQIVADLLDADTRRRVFDDVRPDEVVHLAAIPAPRMAPEDETYLVNTTLALGVVEESLRTGVRALLVASSPTVIGYGSPSGWAPAYLPIDEDHPVAPWNAYALSKVAVEELMRMVARRDGDRIRVGSFRPSYVVAPEEWLGAPTQQGHTIRERLAQPELAVGSFFNYLDARDAGDFVVAWLDAPDSTPNGEVFFVAAPDPLVTGSVHEAIARALPAAAPAASSIGDTGPLFSTERAARLLGWHARRTWRTELPEEGADD
ncbi:NAD(P)-dependent oxidoreductase [Homoserinibacter sp. GY 40078]|uniref:NAD-dependent epimerase/dehydratase family protein n=1 Tax=Homoserinibacter sp. GY 40078 TaxID=2603275 RepID=UPI0011CAFE5F|nr:NAD(P)-dependent oxidoreductase [Homoserinibacter sp. GY 40078]TXK19020.1 NAD(P)-dependent oxidoreductase [Homoserinibacter sp. GY 40078]